MKIRRLLLLVALFTAYGAGAQNVIYQEGFEGTPAVTSGGTPGWALETNYFNTGTKSYVGKIVNPGDSMTLTTNAFSTQGSLVVTLKFSHIAKIEFFDAAEIYVSNNNGTTWTKLTGAHYLGQSGFGPSTGDKFNSTTYMDWQPGTPGAPLNTWWREETFNISSIAANSNQVRIMFMLRDMNFGTQHDNWGWLLDDIQVTIPSAQEASLEGILLPMSLPSGCGLDNEVIQIRIANNGGQNINGNLMATFQREGQFPVTEVVPDLIAPGDTLNYTFTSQIDLFSNIDTTYEVKAWINLLSDPNQSNDTLVKIFDSKVALPDPVINDTIIPYGSSVTLTAVHNDSITWYSDPLALNQLQKGASFTTPVLYDSAVYYVQGGIPGIQSYYVGPLNPSIGTISSTTLTNHFVIFDVLNPNGITLEAFEMYPTGSIGSPFTIVVQNSAQQQIASYTGVTTVTGGSLQTVVANLNVPFGTGYRLGFTTNPGFNRNTTGAVYPYTIPGEISITGNTFNVVYAYFFYNWKVTTGGGSAGCPSKVLPVTVALSGMPYNDAGVTLVSPSGNITAGTPYPVEVTIQNFGLDPLTKVTINHSIGGSLQSPFIWTGNLPKNGTAGPIQIGTAVFGTGVSQIIAWTSQPNDSLDWANHNDTANATVYSCLSGTVTVGGAAADFNTFADLYAVVNLVGLCGPTIIEVNPGIYNQQVILSGIMGLNSTNTLTIRSASQNPADVVIEYAATGTTDNFVIKLDGASYITIEDITFRATGASYGRVVEFANGSNYNIFRGNRIESLVGSTSSNWSGIYSASNAPSNFNLFEENVISGGYYGIYWYGSSANRKKGNIFRNNTFEGYYYYGIYSYYSDSTIISDNSFSNAANSGITYHIYYYYNDGFGLIEKNRIIGTNTTTFYGITVGQSTGVSPTAIQISNNYVYQSVGTGTVYAIYLTTNNNKVNIYNNTVHVTGGSATAGRGLYTTGGTGMIDIVNNIFHNSAGGYAYYVNTVAQVGVSDYNNLFTTGTSVGYWSAARATLAALQSASGKDANSKSVNSNFIYPLQPYLLNTVLDGAATPLATVTDDIDGNPRNATTPDIGAVEFQIVPNDAGISMLVSPDAPCAGDTTDVIVRLTNFGTSPLTSCGIKWSVNGVMQDSVAFSGSLASGASVHITVGQLVMNPGTPYDFIAYTTFPNMVADMINANDTLKVTGMQTAMSSGVYTIGGVGADYPTIGAAVQALNQFGVCGPVVFNINPGTYLTNMLLDNIHGTSSVNTITFQSTNADSSSVIIQYAAAAAADNYVVKLIATSHVTFRQLTFRATGASNGRVVELANGSHYNVFEGCRILTSTTSTSSNYAGVYVAGVSNNYNRFTGNLIEGGYYGIYWYGSSSSARGHNLIIENNKILSSYYYGVNIAYYDTLTFNGNLVTSAANSGTIYGARIYYCDIIDVIGNDIQIAGTSTHYGMYIYYCYGTSGRRNLIANNFVSLTGTGTSTWYGAYFYYNQYSDVYHNSFHMTAGSSTAYTFYQSGGTDLNMVNNIFSNAGGGYAYYIGTPAAVTTSNYNNFYATGPSLAYWSAAQANLAALQVASGKDSNSKSTDPLFFSNKDLHVMNGLLNGAGTPLPSVPFDIDGEPRSTTHPDIGADEFVVFGKIISLVDIIGQYGGCGFDSTNITLRVMSLGVDTIDASSNLAFHFRINQQPPVAETFAGTLLPGDTAVYTFSTKAYFPLTQQQDSTFNLNVWISMDSGVVVVANLATTVWNGYQPPSPIVSDTTIPYATSVTLHAISQDSVLWYASQNAQQPLAGGNNFTTPTLLTPKTYWVEGVGSGTSGGGAFIMTEIAHYKVSTGAPVGGWPSYLLADDYIEITGAPGSDLGGFTLEQWDVSGMVSTHTFPSNTKLGPNGTAIIAVGQLSSSVPVPSSFYYHGNGSYTGSFSSTGAAGRILKSPSNQIIDAVGYGSYTFPAAAGVTAADWSGSTPAVSSSGNRLAGPYTKNATNWINSGVQPQDPNTLNNGVTIPSGGGCPSARVPITVLLSGMPPYDLGVSAISITEGCIVDKPLTIEVYNQGTDTLHTGGLASYRINNQPWITPENINVPIAPGDTILYTFSTLVNYNPAQDTIFKITAHVSVSGDPYLLNDTLAKDSLKGLYTPPPPVMTNVTIPYATFTTLTAQSNDTVFWYAQPTDSVEIATGSQFTTPTLFGTTTYWAEARSGSLTTGSNIALNAVATHSSGGATTYGPDNYNDGVISAYGNLPWGWVTTNGSIELTWPNPVTFNAVKFYKDNRPMATCTFEYWNGSTFIPFYNYNSTVIDDSVGFNPVTTTILRFSGIAGSSNPNFREIEVFMAGAGGCPSPRVPVIVSVGNPPPIDAGMHSVVHPVGAVPSGTNHNIDVRVQNYGTDTLTSFTLTYELNGVVKGSYNWTGSLAPLTTSQPITVYTDNFAGGVYTMRVWVSNANGTTQGVNSNDTIVHSFAACLNGTYTLGGAGSDFPTFASAINAITAAGVCGHVTFMVQPGTYNGQLIFNFNANINANNTVTFQGATGDSTQVVLQYGAAGTGDNWVVRFNDAQYITFKHMTIRATGGTYGYAVTFTGNASNNSLIGNVIQTAVSTSSSFSGIYVSSSLSGNNLIKGNMVLGGYYGIYWFAPSSTSRSRGNTFEDNIIRNFYYYGANIAYVDSITFNNNVIENGSNSGIVYGARIYYCDYMKVIGNRIAISGTSTHYGLYLYNNLAVSSNRNLVANNFVSLYGSGTSTWYGMYVYGPTFTDFYHNSVHHTGGSTTAGGPFYLSTGSNNNLVNNIFSNVGGGYTYYIASTGALATSNFNNFWGTGSSLAYWGAAVSNLAALKSTSGKEQNSISVNPQFYSTTNLHVLSNLLNGAGTPLPSVPFDIDGEPRDPMNPDIGADEFTPAPKDIGAAALVTPVAGACFGPNETVTIRIQNYGLDTLNFAATPATVNASVTGVNPVTFPTVTVNTGTLIPGASLNVVVSTSYNMGVNGTYNFNATATIPGDGNAINDPMPSASLNVTAIISNFPYFEDFETAVTGSPGSVTNGWVADPASSSAYSWYVNSGTTSSTSTGPSGDHTTGTGKYVFTESSNGSTGAEAFLTSPCLDLSSFTNPVVKFWYHMYGSTMGTLYTQALDNMGNWVTLDTITGQQHTSENDPWTQRSVDLTGFTGHITKIRFKSVRSTSFYGDMAIDDIYINQPVQFDAGIKEILKPAQNFAAQGSTQKVEVRVQNYGFGTLAGIPVAYRYNNGTVHRDTVIGNFGMDTVKVIEFVPQFTVLSGNRTLEVWTELQGDLVNNNDTLKMTFTGLEVRTVPYCDDFEATNLWVGSGGLMQWQQGTPGGGIINTAKSGTKVWATNLTGQYLNNSNDYVYSPYFNFNALSTTDTASLEFWHWMDMQPNNDYAQVQYSLDGGSNWSNLGFYMDPYGTNWYNSTSGGTHYFSATNTGWQKSSYKLMPSTFNQAGLVQFRFRFFSNASVNNYDGWAIDDVCISLPVQPNDVGVTAINYPVQDTAAGSLVHAVVTIKNFGINPQTMFPVELRLNGVVISTETWAGTLNSQATTTYSFVLPFTVPNSTYQLCARTVLTGDAIPSNDEICKGFTALPAYHDVGISRIVSPVPVGNDNLCFYQSQAQPWYQYPVTVKINNYGQNPQTSIPVKYTFSAGGTVYTDTWTGTLAPSDSVDFILTNLFRPNLGSQQVCVETDLTGDVVAVNNKSCRTYIGVACIGIDDPSAPGFALYQNIPNPATSRTTIGYKVPESGDVVFGLVSMIGQVLHSEIQTVPAGENQFELDLTSLAAGVYYYFIEYNGQRLTRKLVIRN
jgi:parallel beta-helix repeat protein